MNSTNVSNQHLNLWTEILLTEDPLSFAKTVVVVNSGEDSLERWRTVAPDAVVGALNRSNEATERHRACYVGHKLLQSNPTSETL
jgi:hypothetical protein